MENEFKIGNMVYHCIQKYKRCDFDLSVDIISNMMECKSEIIKVNKSSIMVKVIEKDGKIVKRKEEYKLFLKDYRKGFFIKRLDLAKKLTDKMAEWQDANYKKYKEYQYMDKYYTNVLHKYMKIFEIEYKKSSQSEEN